MKVVLNHDSLFLEACTWPCWSSKCHGETNRRNIKPIPAIWHTRTVIWDSERWLWVGTKQLFVQYTGWERVQQSSLYSRIKALQQLVRKAWEISHGETRLHLLDEARTKGTTKSNSSGTQHHFRHSRNWSGTCIRVCLRLSGRHRPVPKLVAPPEAGWNREENLSIAALKTTIWQSRFRRLEALPRLETRDMLQWYVADILLKGAFVGCLHTAVLQSCEADHNPLPKRHGIDDRGYVLLSLAKEKFRE